MVNPESFQLNSFIRAIFDFNAHPHSFIPYRFNNYFVYDKDNFEYPDSSAIWKQYMRRANRIDATRRDDTKFT